MESMNLSMLVTTCIMGTLTWVVLNQISVRGDYAAVGFIVASATLFGTNLQLHRTAIDAALYTTSMIVAYLSCALLIAVAYRLSPVHPLSSYPGPRLWCTSSLFLSYVSFTGRRHLLLDEMHHKYGSIIRIGPNTLSVNSSSGNVIYSTLAHMQKSNSYMVPGHVKSVSLFFKQPKKLHSDRKRIWSYAFTGASMNEYFPSLEKRTWQLVSCIESRQSASVDETVDLARCISHWSYDFMGEMVFGGSNELELMRTNDPSRLVEGGKLAMSIVESIGQSPWLMDIVWHLPASRSITRLRDEAAILMRNRVQVNRNIMFRDLSSYLIAGDPHTGEKLSLSDLELDAIVAIQAGSDNTATVIAMIFFFLLSQPEYYTRLQKELDEAFSNHLNNLDHSILADLAFLNGVVNETLRLGTPFFLPRIVPPGGITIDEKYIPEDTVVVPAAYSQQVSPMNFSPDPLRFRPERWLLGGLGPGSVLNKTAMFSFSSGPHVCVARAFAYQEIRFVVTRIALTFDMEFPEDFDSDSYRSEILNVRTTMLQPLPIRARRRASSMPLRN